MAQVDSESVRNVNYQALMAIADHPNKDQVCALPVFGKPRIWKRQGLIYSRSKPESHLVGEEFCE